MEDSLVGKRLASELRLAEGMLELYPDKTRAAELAAVRARLGAQEDVDLVAECEAGLAANAAFLKGFTTHMVAHAHIDMNWMWGYDETAAVVMDTFRTMLRLMDRYPEFTFSQSQAAVYRIVERHDPAMLRTIKRRVAEGRWEVSSCTWVEADKNMASGESQVRQVLYAKRYFRDLLGLDYDRVSLDFEPDTFGHNLNIPAILARAGVKYYYRCRASKGPKLYNWQAPDGSRTLCYFENGADWYNYGVTPERLVASALREAGETGLKDILRVYGVGDHGGGPTVKDIESIREMARWPVFPTIKFSTYADYFGAAERQASELPLHQGEHNYVFTGCYTSQSEIKRGNRQGERALAAAETFSALADRLDIGFEYPREALAGAWEKVLFNQFHDILPGSGRRETRHYAMGQYQEVNAAAASSLKGALAALAGTIDTASVLKAAGLDAGGEFPLALGAGVGFGQDFKGFSTPAVDGSRHRLFTVFNPSPFPRSEVVEVELWDFESQGELVVSDDSGKSVEYQLLDEVERSYWAHKFRRLLFMARDVPSLGYRTFVVHCDANASPLVTSNWDARLEFPARATLENDRLRLELDVESGAVKRLTLKDGGLELVPEGGALGLFRVIDEASALVREQGGPVDGMSAWLVGSYSRVEPLRGVRFVDDAGKSSSPMAKSSFKAVKGPLRDSLVWTAEFRHSRLTTAIYLEHGSDVLRFDCKVDWLEVGSKERSVPQLNIVFPLPVEGSTRLFEAPFAALRRDAVDMDVPALRWADISGELKAGGGLAGLTVMTDSKYGHRAGEGFLAVSLLRSSYDPDPYPELGEHRFSLGLRPHHGGCDTGEAFRQAQIFDQPLVVTPALPTDGKLSANLSFMGLDVDNLVMSALKRAEDGQAMALRFYEIAGHDTEATLTLHPSLRGGEFKFTEADLLERKTGSTVCSHDGKATIRVPAHGLLTLLLEFGA